MAKKTVGPTGTPFKAPFDLRTAFADVGAATGPVTIRAGRQELVYGEQRLVGHVSWLNAARTFDGVKVTFRTKAFSADVFATSVVRILDGEFDKSGNGNRFAGVYGTTTKLIPQASVEPYVLFKRDVNLRARPAGSATLNETTTGVRIAGKLPARLDYGVEMALQRGSLGTDDVSAWAGHWQLRESLPGRAAVRLTGEYNFASGDEDPADSVRGTFDQLYPTPHDKYRPGRPDRLEEHAPRPRRIRGDAVQGIAGHHELSLLVAGRKRGTPSTTSATRSLARVHHGRRRSPRRPGDSTSRSAGRSHRSCRSPPATRTSSRGRS